MPNKNEVLTDPELIASEVIAFLDNIIEENLSSFKDENSFKVRPGYGYDKFYLDSIDGSYDMSLQSLIHYIMYEEGIYKKFLNDDLYACLETVIEDSPESIFGAPMDEDGNYDDELQSLLDDIYYFSIKHVAERLLNEGFDIKHTFADYLS